MILDQIAHSKKILILGYGREGVSTYQFFKSRFPKLKIATADQKDGPNYLQKIFDYKIIVKTPGISPHLPEIVEAKKQGTIFTSQMQIFFELCPGKIIGVTGTKGKSTTASLIYKVLRDNGIKSVLAGNIGKPVLDYLEEIDNKTWVVLEMSSYQLMDMTKSPHISVLQNIYPDHLDYHQNFEEYKNAKLNITKYQKSEDYLISQQDISTKAQKIAFKLPKTFIPSKLLGAHNQLNIQPAIIIGKLLKIPQAKILDSIADFKPLETRLENCGTHRGIIFYSDTLATIPEATIAAIETLKPQTLIAGGHDRHQVYNRLGKAIDHSGVKCLILFPNTGERMAKSISRKNILCLNANSMSQAVKMAYEHTSSGKICLLSPAASSFTLFKDYKDEREQYIKYINELR